MTEKSPRRGRPPIGVTQRTVTFHNADLEFLMTIDPSPTRAIHKLIASLAAPKRTAGRPAKKETTK